MHLFVEGIEAAYSFDEFQDLESSLDAGDDLPPELEAIRAGCS